MVKVILSLRSVFMKASGGYFKQTVTKKQCFRFWGLCFLFYFLIMLCAPFTYDDYTFARVPYDSFGQLLNYCLTYGNGRLLGNIGAILLNHFPVCAAIVKGFVFSSIIVLIPGILGLDGRIHYLLSFLLVTAIDPSLFAQVITWTSGFHNYVPPVFLLLTALWLVQKYPDVQGSSIRKILYCVSLFLIGLAAQLYVEHSSVINIAFSAFLVLKAFKDKQKLVPASILLSATVLGIVIMFGIPVYYRVSLSSGSNAYRSFYIDSIFTFVFNCARNALRLSNHYFGLCGVPLCLGGIVTTWMTRTQRKERFNSILFAGSGLPLIYMIVCSAMNAEQWYAEPAILHHTIAMAAVFTALISWLVALFKMPDTLIRNRIWILLGFAVFSLLPLLIVTPIHIRVFYHSQIFIVIAFLLILSKCIETWNQAAGNALYRVLMVTAMVLCVVLSSVFLSIGNMEKARHSYTLQQMEEGAAEIEYFRIPYQHVHDGTDPCMGDYYYYESPRDIQFNIVPFDQWMNDHWDSVA